ncbi:MAG TPA: hypothetical protein EYO33_06740 [Phycisphaerales bacterium]|nr:hypothetical protein [Phycisphaerales bacterium]
MSDFNFTKRGDHFQISSSESSRFILRLNTASSGDNVMIFSEFTFISGENARAVEALCIIKSKFDQPAPGVTMVFENIFPDDWDREGRSEITRRHDQIVSVVKDFASQSNLTVQNAFLELKPGRFQTVIEM